MRFFTALLVLAASTAWGQRAYSPTGFGRNSNPAGVIGTTGGAGFGRMIYPGTGAPAVARTPRNPTALQPAFAPPQVRHGAHAIPIAVPYPVFYGGGYYDYEAPPAPVGGQYSPSDYQVPGYEQMTQPPVVIINQYFRPDSASPVVRDYSNVPLPEAGPRPETTSPASESQVMFLIAMKDHTIFPAVAYWVEGDTLNYITVQGSRNSASLDLVDREFSQQINKERKVEFGLPSK